MGGGRDLRTRERRGVCGGKRGKLVNVELRAIEEES